ncbi:MAG TPA: 2,4-dienoyl-CoA reductase, partial [Clostridium sp.]
MIKYKNVFSPLKIKNMTIKNRIVMPPMGTNYAGQNGEINEEHIRYYEQRAKGGTGLIIVENVSVQFPLGSNGTTQLRIDIDSFMPSLYELTERLHKYGTCVVIQINHSGASAVPERIGCQPVSSSDVPSKTGGPIPRPLDKSEILDIVMKYGKAAKRVQIAGFDAVEIHAGHSYLISQFLSPIYNKRLDEFGGSYQNRARFARMIIDSVRAEVGPQFPIMLRVSADELIEGGNTLEDTLKLLEYLNDEVDIFDVSAGLNDSLQYQIDKMSLKDGWRSYMSREVREKFHKPTITTGNIRNPEIAEKILNDGDADLIGIGRGLIADPNWVTKVKNGQEDMIRKCISCNIGCAGYRIGLNRPIRCTVNPDVINEDSYKNKRVKKQTNVVVIGGGTAGLEAAGTAVE